MNYDKIGNFIQQKRKDKNLTQKQLAEKLGVTDRAISKWERGQGCPDVSILEILSKELGCSILELLKGREIENEVIAVTEADDYVKDSMNISKQITKEKIISILNKIIVGSIVFVFLLLSYFNIIQICYLKDEYTLKITNRDYERIHEKVNVIENNLSIIKNNKGKFLESDYEIILENLDNSFARIKAEKVYNYVLNKKDINYTVNDIFIFVNPSDIVSSQLATTKILDNYSDNNLTSYYRDIVTDDYLSFIYSANFLKTYTSYQYKINPFEDENNFYHIENQEIRGRIYKVFDELSQLEYLTELVMEVGDIHE